MTLQTKIKLSIDSTLATALDLATAQVPLLKTYSHLWTSGTGANQADMIWHDQRTVAASANEDLDLAGVLVNALGVTQTFKRIKALVVIAAATNVNNVNVTRPAANGVPIFLAAGDGMPVLPGGHLYWAAPDATGIAVTAGTGDLINVANSGAGTGVTYDVIIIGASI